jgi:hypothetical protein
MTQPFTIIKPITVDDSSFVSSSLTENDYAEWAVGTTYAVGNRVIVIDNGASPPVGIHKIYESLEAGNVGNSPPTSPTKWVEVGPTNRWAVFDESGGTKSTGTSPVSWTIETGRIDSVAVLEIENANSVQIIGYSPSEGSPGIVYDETYTLDDTTVVVNWFEYFFSPIRKGTEVLVTDIPPYQDLELTVIVEGAGELSVGTILFGNSTEIGLTSLGAKSGIIDYSRKEVDQFGRATLVKRKFSKRMDVTLLVDNSIVDSVQYLLSDLRATPVLWVAAKGTYELLTIYGFYRDFSIDISYPNQSLCTLEIEGLT